MELSAPSIYQIPYGGHLFPMSNNVYPNAYTEKLKNISGHKKPLLGNL